jgi:hypothetical protein
MDIAPRVGLDPVRDGSDIPPFDMHYARLPNVIFNQIVRDLQVYAAQYGPMRKHKNEEARSRFLSAVNTPSSLKAPILHRKLITNIRLVFQSNCGPLFWSFV